MISVSIEHQYDSCQQADLPAEGIADRTAGVRISADGRADGRVTLFTGIPQAREAPVATGPGTPMAAAPDDYGRMRASRADREQVIDALKAAFVQGRLTKDELDERVARALVPLTYAELSALTDDLPAGLASPREPGPLVESSAAKAGVYVALVAGLFLVAAISNGTGNPLAWLGSALFLSPIWLLALAGLLALHARLDRRPAGHRSARSGATRSAGPFGS